MIDFKNAAFLKLQPISSHDGLAEVSPLLVTGEEIFAVYKSVRDMIVFTNKRIITINVQGITGNKKDYTSLPYKLLQAVSVATTEELAKDCELELLFAGAGKVRFEFKSRFDIKGFNKILAPYIF